MKKKIAYLVSEYPGISHTFIHREISYLRNKGFNIETVSIGETNHLEKMTIEEKEEYNNTFCIKKTNLGSVIIQNILIIIRYFIYYIRALTYTFSLSSKGSFCKLKCLFYFVEAVILVLWLKKKRINHIHVHFGNPAATVALIASQFPEIEYSMSIHGPDIFYDITLNVIKEKIINARAVRCISYYSQSQLMRLVPYKYWKKFSIVRCGIDPKVYRPNQKISSDVIELLCLGRLVPSKGQHNLLEAISILKHKEYNFHLTFVGDGIDRKSLQNYVDYNNLNECVTFSGAVGQQSVHDFYDKADIFILPSFAEGVPVALMEAMAKEIAVISTNITGISELIEHGKDGLLYSASDSYRLVEYIEKVMNDYDYRQSLSKNARIKVLDMYNLESNAYKMEDFFVNFVFTEGVQV